MRRLPPLGYISLIACGLATAPLPVLAQQGKARVQTAPSVQQEQATDGELQQVQAVDPKLEAVLKEWFAKTKNVQKLQGEHTRFSYEMTFSVATVSEGKFYYEAPDKGRIDIEPTPQSSLNDVDPNTGGVQIMDDAKNVYTCKDDQPERWICDGAQLLKIDDTAKTYELLPIPESHQGANIMDGPLPFLFGLPPEKAKARYAMELKPHNNPSIVYLVVKPRMQQDAANWQRADVMLSRETFLPQAVRLLDPSGNRITVFAFKSQEANKVNLLGFFGQQPFRPSLFGYKQVQSQQPQAAQPLNVAGEPIKGVPAVIGLSHEDAKNVLGQRGYQKLRIIPDNAPSPANFRHRVKQQSPPPNANVSPDETVTLVLYVTEDDLKNLQKRQAANQ